MSVVNRDAACRIRILLCFDASCILAQITEAPMMIATLKTADPTMVPGPALSCSTSTAKNAPAIEVKSSGAEEP